MRHASESESERTRASPNNNAFQKRFNDGEDGDDDPNYRKIRDDYYGGGRRRGIKKRKEHKSRGERSGAGESLVHNIAIPIIREERRGNAGDGSRENRDMVVYE